MRHDNFTGATPTWIRVDDRVTIGASLQRVARSRTTRRSDARSRAGPGGGPSSARLVRPDQHLLARRLPAVGRDRLEPQGPGQRQLARVAAGEGGLELADDARAQLLARLGTDPLQKEREQPAAEAPGHAVGPVEDRGRAVEPAVDVDLLVGAAAVAAEAGRRAARRELHAAQDLVRESSAAGGVEAQRRARLDQRVDQILPEA